MVSLLSKTLRGSYYVVIIVFIYFFTSCGGETGTTSYGGNTNNNNVTPPDKTTIPKDIECVPGNSCSNTVSPIETKINICLPGIECKEPKPKPDINNNNKESKTNSCLPGQVCQ